MNLRLPATGDNPHGNHPDPLDELVFIILSAQTESYLYLQTFRALRNAFDPWDRLLNASAEEIASLIRRGGLARKKAAQLIAAFTRIRADRGSLTLDFLHELPDEEALAYLVALPGVGSKTAKCVMMYSLRRPVFPVDTHVWRIARRLGLAPTVPKPTDAQERALERDIPHSLRFDLHVKLVSLGKDTCHTYFPKCGGCSLADICPSNGQPDTVWRSWRQPKGIWASAKRKITPSVRTA